ncbi:hypothetical protein FRC04_006366 [Tulasnella sp. 424]|nr:hypothetical protein FRC04_006366 [Tulasnella sp. 424]KAG8980419.1 hypothetical protein FRC05_006050 [Tulasnella sp. 425]
MPLKFPNVVAELNLVSTLALLNFASGYRVPLHVATGRGAYDNIRALLFSFYLTSAEGSGADNLLSAKGMVTITRNKVAELMNIPIRQEKPVPGMPGIVMSEVGGPLLELVDLVASTLVETGQILLNGGYPDLGTFVLEALNEAKREADKSGTTPLVPSEVILERLVKAFPAFQDMYLINEAPVYIFKKALLLIHTIVLRFETSKAVPIPDTGTLPVFADNVLPSMLVHLGVIDLSECTVGSLKGILLDSKDQLNAFLSSAPVPGDAPGANKAPPKEGPHLSKEEAFVLRASAVDACELIVEAAHSIVVPEDEEKQAWLRNIKLPQLDGWLWAVAKDRLDYRSLERFVETATVFY